MTLHVQFDGDCFTADEFFAVPLLFKFVRVARLKNGR